MIKRCGIKKVDIDINEKKEKKKGKKEFL